MIGTAHRLINVRRECEGGEEYTARLSLEQIKSLPRVEVTTTLQCSGNRRGDFNGLRRTSGTPWGQGAISTAKWGGARLVDVLVLASDQLAREKGGKNGNDDVRRRSASKLVRSEQSNGDDDGNDGLLRTLQGLRGTLDATPTSGTCASSPSTGCSRRSTR